MPMNPSKLFTFILISGLFLASFRPLKAQDWKLTSENISNAIRDSAVNINKDPFRPGFHLTPPVGCMGDPNGGIFYNGWYHIFYGLQPFAFHPGAWFWAHARSRDLLHWEHMPPGLTPAFELGLDAIGSGSTIITKDNRKLAFYSQSQGGPMMFWRSTFTNDDLSQWNHDGRNPVITLDLPGLPPYDDFFRDPFVFEEDGRTFLIACADLFEEDYVPVPIFEALNDALTEWEYKGNLFTVPKHKYRNLEVPEFRKLDDQWIFMASTDAPTDRVNYFIGQFDIETLTFTPEYEGPVDYSGHYYAQEAIQNDNGELFLMAWMPGWDREWLPWYMNEPKKNSNPLWNGCFAIPRKLNIENGRLIQQPVESVRRLRNRHISVNGRDLPVSGPVTAVTLLDQVRGDQLEILAEFDLHNAAFCGLNLLSGDDGMGGLSIAWSGNMLNIDGVTVPITEWKQGDPLHLQIFVDKKFVEVFVNNGKYCITRQVMENHVAGNHVALTSLGGTARLVSMEAWTLKPIH